MGDKEKIKESIDKYVSMKREYDKRFNVDEDGHMIIEGGDE